MTPVDLVAKLEGIRQGLIIEEEKAYNEDATAYRKGQIHGRIVGIELCIFEIRKANATMFLDWAVAQQ